jgi:acetolactate synthase-1/2/3 large subunit
MKNGAQLLVECLERQGVKYIFGIPGAKVDAIFDALADGGPELILCRHEQNASFMAACVGRLTGSPGVVLVTSGPGVSNLTTGLATATTEGDPLVALGGAVSRSMRLKQTHQSMDNVSVMKPVTKSSVEVVMPENIPEVVANAFRLACEPRGGATFISLPQDILNEPVSCEAADPVPYPSLGAAPPASIEAVAQVINSARQPVLLLGLEAGKPENTEAIRAMLAKTQIATIETFEAAGALSRDLVSCFVGRVGLFRNQPGDQLLKNADVVLCIGFDPVEYDPEIWNPEQQLTIIHLDANSADIGRCYRPGFELIGDIAASVTQLSLHLNGGSIKNPALIAGLRSELDAGVKKGPQLAGFPVHPLRFIHDLQTILDDNMTIISDIGSHYMWLARHLYCYRPHHLLFSNGQQTLGVALPWAMAASMVRPEERVISISGDGGFLFSAMELETAVRYQCRFVHCVWRDGSYDMVGSQEQIKYGRRSGVNFGEVDLVKFAESFGATGFAVRQVDELLPTLQKALEIKGPVLIDIPIDYSDNAGLFAATDSYGGH